MFYIRSLDCIKENLNWKWHGGYELGLRVRQAEVQILALRNLDNFPKLQFLPLFGLGVGDGWGEAGGGAAVTVPSPWAVWSKCHHAWKTVSTVPCTEARRSFSGNICLLVLLS